MNKCIVAFVGVIFFSFPITGTLKANPVPTPLPDNIPATVCGPLLRFPKVSVNGNLMKRKTKDTANIVWKYQTEKNNSITDVPYSPEGIWDIFYDSHPWLEGSYKNGAMNGDWKLWDYSQSDSSISANFVELFNKATGLKATQIFPYYVDMEGRGKNEIIFIYRDGLAILDSETKGLIAKITDFHVDNKPTTEWNDPRFYWFSPKPIWDGGPYCFCYQWSRVEFTDMGYDRPAKTFLHYVDFYTYQNGKLHVVFSGELDDFDVPIAFDDKDSKGFRILDLKYYKAKWNPAKNRFIKMTKR